MIDLEMKVPTLVFEGCQRDLRLLVWFANQKTGASIGFDEVDGKYHLYIEGDESLVWRTIDVMQERMREGHHKLNLLSGGLPR